MIHFLHVFLLLPPLPSISILMVLSLALVNLTYLWVLAYSKSLLIMTLSCLLLRVLLLALGLLRFMLNSPLLLLPYVISLLIRLYTFTRTPWPLWPLLTQSYLLRSLHGFYERETILFGHCSDTLFYRLTSILLGTKSMLMRLIPGIPALTRYPKLELFNKFWRFFSQIFLLTPTSPWTMSLLIMTSLNLWRIGRLLLNFVLPFLWIDFDF